MPRQISTEIEINAPVPRVWAALTDFSAFPEWNPFIQRVSGGLETGARLEVFIQPAGGRGMTFRPTLITVEPERELRWLGRLAGPVVQAWSGLRHPTGL